MHPQKVGPDETAIPPFRLAVGACAPGERSQTVIRIIDHIADGQRQVVDLTPLAIFVKWMNPAVRLHLFPEPLIPEAAQVRDDGYRCVAKSEVEPRTGPVMMVNDIRFPARAEHDIDRVISQEPL